MKEECSELDIYLEEKESDSGDVCHKNIRELTNGKARRYLLNHCIPQNVIICNDGRPTAITSFKEIENAIKRHKLGIIIGDILD